MRVLIMGSAGFLGSHLSYAREACGHHAVPLDKADPCAGDAAALSGPAVRATNRVFSAVGLSRAQRLGEACAGCDKRWPRPSVPLGELVDGTELYLCTDCAEGLPKDWTSTPAAPPARSSAPHRFAPRRGGLPGTGGEDVGNL
ncbi:hypothetical protein [Actinomadura logoneensis]|nr:hypothetical protein [Actinomadura logoneensis]